MTISCLLLPTVEQFPLPISAFGSARPSPHNLGDPRSWIWYPPRASGFDWSEDLTLDDLNIALVLPSNEAVREAIKAGTSATIISRHVVASAVAAGTLAAMPVNLPPREYALLRHRDRHETMAQQTFVAHVTAAVDAASLEHG